MAALGWEDMPSKEGYIYRLCLTLHDFFPNQSDRGFNHVVSALFRNEPLASHMQLATDVTNYALMRLSFIDCDKPYSEHEWAEFFFNPTVAAALMYRHVIMKYLRLHAPMKVDGRLFEEMIIDITLSALQDLRESHRTIGVCAYLVTVAHFYFIRDIPEYVDLAKKYFARFLSGQAHKKYGEQYLRVASVSFGPVDIGLVRNALMAPYGAGNLETHYQDD